MNKIYNITKQQRTQSDTDFTIFCECVCVNVLDLTVVFVVVNVDLYFGMEAINCERKNRKINILEKSFRVFLAG